MTFRTQPLSSQTLSHYGDDGNDDFLCSTETAVLSSDQEVVQFYRPDGYLTGEAHIERAWAHWNQLGRPKFIVAPMVDNSELPFRLLCRKYGTQAAYTPMLHSRIFLETEKYRSEEFTTCKVSIHLGMSVRFEDGKLDQAELLVEYLKLCEKHPVPWRMVRSHVYKLLGDWFKIHPSVRDDLIKQSTLTFEFLYGIVDRLREEGVRIPLSLKESDCARASANGT